MPKKIGLNKNAIKASNIFMRKADKYSLGSLTTERISRIDLSGAAKSKNGASKAIKLLLNEEKSVYRALKNCQKKGELSWLTGIFTHAIKKNGRIIFIGAGAKFREAVFLEREWKNFINSLPLSARRALPAHILNTVIGIGAGGDLAQIRTVEGMEDVGLVAEREIKILINKFKRSGIAGPIVVIGHDSSGNSLYTVKAVKKAAELNCISVFAINNPAREAKRIPRINDLICDKRIKKIYFKTDSPPVAGSTRLQPTTAGMAVFGEALLASIKESFTGLRHSLRPSLPKKTDISKKILRSINIIKKSTPSLAKFIDLKADIYRNNPAFCSQKNKKSYLTFFSGRRAFLPVLTNEVEEYPTFGTPPYATLKELRSGSPLSPSGILVADVNGKEALKSLFGRTPRGLNLSSLLSKRELLKIYGRADLIPDLGKKRLDGFRFNYISVLKQRPVKKDSMAVLVLMGDDVLDFKKPTSVLRKKFIKARENGAKTAIIAVTHRKIEKKSWPKADILMVVPIKHDVMSIQQSIALKMILNIQSNVTMAKVNKIYGSLMFDVAPSNGKLIDRSTRYVVHAFQVMLNKKINYRTANRFLFEALAFIKKNNRECRIVSSPVKLAFLSCYKKISMLKADEMLKNCDSDLDAIIKLDRKKSNYR